MSQGKQRNNSSCNNAESLPALSLDDALLPTVPLAPQILTTLTLISNVVVVQPSSVNDAVIMEDELQLAYRGYTNFPTFTAPDFDDMLQHDTGTADRIIHDMMGNMAEGSNRAVNAQLSPNGQGLDDIMDIMNDIGVVEAVGPVSNPTVGVETEAVATSNDYGVVEAVGPVSNPTVGVETEAVAANISQNRIVVEAQVYASSSGNSGNLLDVIVPDVITIPGDDYDSAEEFQPSPAPSKSSRGKAKATVPQMGIGSSGKGVSSRKGVKRPNSASSNKQIKNPKTGNDDTPILRKMLNAPPLLPAVQLGFRTRAKNSTPKRQVKGGAGRSVVPAGNIVAGRPGISGAVLPAPRVITPIIDVDAEEPREGLSQRTHNVLNDYRALCERYKRQESEDRENCARSGEDLIRTDEALRRAQEALRHAEEARRVAFDTDLRNRRAWANSSKNLQQINRT